jgi:predicted phage replisome organizer
MSDNKKYYYLKLKDSFFDSEEMKILESQKNGIEYQNLYLKLCLLSLKSEGKLMFKDCLPYDLNMISTVLRVNIDTVKTGIELFQKLGLIDIMDSGLIFMSDIQSLIGAGSSEGDRKKIYREKIKSHKKIEGGQMSDKRPPEIELEKELELEKEIKRKIPPSLEELKQYLSEQNITQFSADNFYDYYEAKGWMIGKNKMKDWRAAVRTWKSRNKSKSEMSEEELFRLRAEENKKYFERGI